MSTSTATKTHSDALLFALRYIERGWSPIPVLYRQKKPGHSGNILLHTWGAYEFNAGHFEGQSNVGIKLGDPSGGLVDIDLDCAEAVLLAEHFLPHTAARFGRNSPGSEHWLYVAKGAKTTQLQDPFMMKDEKMIVELRSTKSQSVFPPSVHESGEQIRWIEEGEPREIGEDDLKRACERLAAAVVYYRMHTETSRHVMVGPFAGYLRKGGMSADDVLDFMMKVIRAANDREARDRERFIRDTNREFDAGRDCSGIEKLKELGCHPERLRLISRWLGLTNKTMKLEEAVRCTDSGNAQYLVEKYRDEFRWCPEKKNWFHWQAGHWYEDEANEISAGVDRIMRQNIDELNEARAPRKLLDWGVKSLMKPRLDAAEALARAHLVKSYTEFNTDPWLLSVENGTLNLKTGELLPHNPDDFIMSLIPIVYDPDAQCPRWEQYMLEIMCENEELVRFLQRAIGYSLTGLTNEQCLFVLYGSGANGKGVLIRILKMLLADYFWQANFNTFLQRETVTDAPRSDIASMAGRRLVSASEVRSKARLDEALVKEMTGEDTVSARFLHKNDFNFKPTHKIWLSANHKPVIRGRDDGIWRRIKLIPFNAQFLEGSDKRDPNLVEKLHAELPGILAWAVRGCLEWQHDGLKAPEVVKSATSEYREESDILAGFFAERIEIDPAARTDIKDLYKEYESWCQGEKLNPMTKMAFGEALRVRKFPSERLTTTGKPTVHHGLRIAVR